jgi:hypothetical protein
MKHFDKDEFVQLVKDLLPHLHDFSVLQTHPLADTGPFTSGDLSSRGENLQRMVFDTIEMLKPKGIKQAPAVIEWRPYLILHKRYVEGLNLQELSVSMSLSERQIRRDHNRAVLALAGRLWDQLFPPKATVFPSRYRAHLEAPQETAREVYYEVLPEVLDLNDLLRGAANIMRLRLEEEDVELELVLPESPLKQSAIASSYARFYSACLNTPCTCWTVNACVSCSMQMGRSATSFRWMGDGNTGSKKSTKTC